MADNSHDEMLRIVTRIDTNLTAYMARFDEHDKKDDSRFRWLERLAYGGVGVVVFVEIISKFIK